MLNFNQREGSLINASGSQKLEVARKLVRVLNTTSQRDLWGSKTEPTGRLLCMLLQGSREFALSVLAETDLAKVLKPLVLSGEEKL